MSQQNLSLQPLEDDALAKSARHKTVSQSSLYYQNCLNKWESSGFHTDLWCSNKVSPWKSIFYGTGNTPRQNDDPKSRTRKTLPQLASWYISDILKFTADFTWREALKASVENKSNQTASERMREFFTKNLSVEKQRIAELLFQECGNTVPVTVALEVEVGRNDGLDLEKDDDGNCHLDHGDDAVEQDQDEGNNNNKRKRNEDGEKTKERSKRREVAREGLDPIKMDVDRTELRVVMESGTREDVFGKVEAIVLKFGNQNKGVVKKDWEWFKRLRKSKTDMQKCIDQCHGGEKALFFLQMENSQFRSMSANALQKNSLMFLSILVLHVI